MLSHFQHLERVEGVPFGPALVLRGAKERLAPIMMTACATGLALVPLAVAGSIPGHEIEHPMAIVILGGLVTSTLLNLFVLPSLYLRFGEEQRRNVARLGSPRPGRPIVRKGVAFSSAFHIDSAKLPVSEGNRSWLSRSTRIQGFASPSRSRRAGLGSCGRLEMTLEQRCRQTNAAVTRARAGCSRAGFRPRSRRRGRRRSVKS